MLAAGRVSREPSILVGVLAVGSLLLMYFALGHIPWGWEQWSRPLFGSWSAPVSLPSNPYTISGLWMQ